MEDADGQQQEQEHLEGKEEVKKQWAEVWSKLERFSHRLSKFSGSSYIHHPPSDDPSAPDDEDSIVLELLGEVDLQKLFAAAYTAHADPAESSRQRMVASTLTSVFGSPASAPTLLASLEAASLALVHGLTAPTFPSLRQLTAKVLVALTKASATPAVLPGGMEDEEERGLQQEVCCQLLQQPPLLRALVHAVRDESLVVSQTAVDVLVGGAQVVNLGGAGGGNDGSTLLQAIMEEIRSAVAAAQSGEEESGGDAATAAASAAVAWDGTFALRYAEAVVRLCATGEAATRVGKSSGAVHEVLLPLLRTDDVLLKLNALELLEHLCATKEGVALLFQEGHVEALLQLVGGGGGGGDEGGEEEEGVGGDPLLGGSALRVIGAIYARAAQTHAAAAAAAASSPTPSSSSSSSSSFDWAALDPSLARRFLRASLRLVAGADGAGKESAKLAALDAVATFAGSSTTALRTVLSDEAKGGGRSLCDSWLNLRKMHKPEIKAAALHSVARVLGCPPIHVEDSGSSGSSGSGAGGEGAGHVSAELSQLRRQLFDAVGALNGLSSTMDLVMQLLSQDPLPELRYAAYDLCRCAAWQRGAWGLRALYGHAAWKPYLENRSTETTKAGREWKFSVIEAVMACSERHAVLDASGLQEVDVMLRQGPFYVPKQQHDVEVV